MTRWGFFTLEPQPTQHRADRRGTVKSRGGSTRGGKVVACLVAAVLFTWNAGAVDLETRNWVVTRESQWRNVSGDGGKSVGLGQIQRRAWQDVSRDRAKRGLIWWDYSAAWDKEINLIYTAEYLEICRRKYLRIYRKEPTRDQLWRVYRGL